MVKNFRLSKLQTIINYSIFSGKKIFVCLIFVIFVIFFLHYCFNFWRLTNFFMPNFSQTTVHACVCSDQYHITFYMPI